MTMASVTSIRPGVPPPLWKGLDNLPARNWTCGHCGRAVANNKGYANEPCSRTIYICPGCSLPTFFEGDRQVPGAAFGNMVNIIPPHFLNLGRRHPAKK